MGGGGPPILLAPMSSEDGSLTGQHGDRMLELGPRDTQVPRAWAFALASWVSASAISLLPASPKRKRSDVSCRFRW